VLHFRSWIRVLIALIAVLAIAGAGPKCDAQSVSPLFARGYTVLPEPQKVLLGAGDFAFTSNWRLAVDASVPSNDVAVEILQQDLASRFHLHLPAKDAQRSRGPDSTGEAGVLSLLISPNAVQVGDASNPDHEKIAEQAYRIDLSGHAIKITANTSTGLFYGVETLLQLLRPGQGKLWLPEGTIEDWPNLYLRHIYWDDAHHLDRMDEIKHTLRQAAFYKINGLTIKLEGHFQYASAPAVVEPYALSAAQFQELTDYGLRYHIQLIPYLDGPAHIAFILKHPEYAKLRAFPNSNYELCITNPKSYELLEGMYKDLLDANKGVKYFYLSTDEPYYLGLAHNSQCNEVKLAAQLGSVGETFVQFANTTGAYLHDRGRTVIFWGEYPMKSVDIPELSPFLVNGEVYGPAFDKAFHQHGMRQMIFTSTEGEEKWFPDYFLLPESERLHPGYSKTTRVQQIYNKISFDPSRKNSHLIGMIDAGWGDMGLHPETFWLGYVIGGATGWHPASSSPQEMMASFYSLFYGPQVVSMDRVYQLLSDQSQFWADSWDETDSSTRKPIWGSSYEIYKTPKPAHDQTLPLPAVPTSDLTYNSHWAASNLQRTSLAAQFLQRNDQLVGLLHQDMLRAEFNRYNLQVYLTIAQLCRQNLKMLAGVARMDRELAAASQVRNIDSKQALKDVDQAIDQAITIQQERNQVLQSTEQVWDKSWFPRVPQANGRRFLHELDDVKDHLPDRSIDLSYVVYREDVLPFGEWVNGILAARNAYAAAHHLPARPEHFDWSNLTSVSGH